LAKHSRPAGISMKKPGQEMHVEGQRISFSGMSAFEGISGLRR
jgi:hypothetical protein